MPFPDTEISSRHQSGTYLRGVGVEGVSLSRVRGVTISDNEFSSSTLWQIKIFPYVDCFTHYLIQPTISYLDSFFILLYPDIYCTIILL